MISRILTPIIFIAAIVIAFYFYFNKNPIRTISPEKNIVSPADGKITEIIDCLKLKKKHPKIGINKKLFGKIKEIVSEVSDHCYVICIAISPFDVHVQRAPVEGTIVSIKRENGKFLSSKNLESAFQNKRTEILIKSKGIGKIKVIQAAAFLGRRIESFVKKGEKLLKGQRIGRIKMEGIVVLVIPDLHLMVKKEDKVIAGETVIAVYE